VISQVQPCVKSPAFWLGALTLAVGLATSLGAGDTSPSRSAGSIEEKLLREGTRIENRPAEIRQEAERIAIYLADHHVPLLALENLAMQRILRAVVDDPADKHWTVTGTVTEFQGRNFLLLERVTRASK
jgi:hypothetical protein